MDIAKAAIWRKPGWMLRALLVVVILVPLVVGLLIKFLNLPASAVAGLVLLAAAPGAPLMTKRSQMAGADPVASAGLQLNLGETRKYGLQFSLRQDRNLATKLNLIAV